MISVNDFKTGLTISVDNGIWKVIDFQHVKPGKGSAFVKLLVLMNSSIKSESYFMTWTFLCYYYRNFSF
ncbi:hypothetical protein ACQKHK_07590, partial [Staphylococcus capitis]